MSILAKKIEHGPHIAIISTKQSLPIEVYYTISYVKASVANIFFAFSANAD